MKTFLLPILLTLTSLSTLPAATLVSGTLADYIALGTMGGTIGSTRFSNFTLLPLQTGATELSPDTIIVNPISGPNGPGFQFIINDSASEDDLFQSYFSFTVSESLINGATIGLTDTATSGGSSLSVIGDFDFPAQPDTTLLVFRTAGDQELEAQETFDAVPSFNVALDITLDGGGEEGLASLGSVTTQFNVVPEPMSTALLGLPMALMIVLRRRRD